MSILRDLAGTMVPGLVVAVVSLAAAEVGYRIGCRLKRAADEAMRSEINTIQAGTISLLALLIGFSFSIAANSYENRRMVILEEAVAIATAHQRALLLPEPEASQVRRLLVEFADTRRDLFYQGVLGEPQVRSRLREAERLQSEMWEHAADAARRDPRSVPQGLALDALSHVGDLNQRRSLALRRTLPLAMVVALIVTAAVAMGWVGCGIGLGPRRNFAMSVVLSVLFGLIIAFIIDMDEPRHGIIHSDPEPLLELQDTLKGR